MDKTHAEIMAHYMIGNRADGLPHSPELRGFVAGRLGHLTPTTGNLAVYPGNGSRDQAASKAFIALLRELADVIEAAN